MRIHYKGIVQERFDAPFIGTLIITPDCNAHCRGCCNQHLKDLPVIVEEEGELFDKILQDPFTEGVILAGLEPLCHYDEVLAVIEKARSLDLEIILYTHYTIQDIRNDYSELLHYKGMYIKCGEYDDQLLSSTYTSYGVHLASTNQRIYKLGEDI